MIGMGIGMMGLIGFSSLGPSWSGYGLDWLIIWWVIGMAFIYIAYPIAELIANKDSLIKPRIFSTFKYPRKVQYWWMDKTPLDSGNVTYDPGLFGPQDRWTASADGRRISRPRFLEYGYSQVPVMLKQNMPMVHPYNNSEHYKVYIRFKGDYAKRMPMLGCFASRWNFYDLWIKKADDPVLYEVPWDGKDPASSKDSPVKESDGSWHPVYVLYLAPGDYPIWAQLERNKRKNLLTSANLQEVKLELEVPAK